MSRQVSNFELSVKGSSFQEEDGTLTNKVNLSIDMEYQPEKILEIIVKKAPQMAELLEQLFDSFDGGFSNAPANDNHTNDPATEAEAKAQAAAEAQGAKSQGTDAPIADDGGYVPTPADAACAEGQSDEVDDPTTVEDESDVVLLSDADESQAGRFSSES